MIKIKKTLLFTFIGLFLVLGAVFTTLFQGVSSPPPPGRWQPVSLPPTYNPATGMTYTIPLAGVAYGNGTFVAVGWNGTILTAPGGGPRRGLAWTSHNSGTSMFLSGVAYGNGTFLTVGLNGVVLTSPDGVAWTKSSDTVAHLSEVTCNRGTFVAVGDKGTILTSPDGVHWTPGNSGTGESLSGIAYGNGIFVAVGANSTIVRSLPKTTL